MNRFFNSFCVLAVFGTLFLSLLMGGCVTTGVSDADSTSGEGFDRIWTGTNFIGRRVVAEKLMYWGYLKPEGFEWGPRTTRLVVIKEMPEGNDRILGARNNDNYEYRMMGYFSGETAYEPKSDYLLDVFVVQHYELISTNNAPLNFSFPVKRASGGYAKKPTHSDQSSKKRPVQFGDTQ